LEGEGEEEREREEEEDEDEGEREPSPSLSQSSHEKSQHGATLQNGVTPTPRPRIHTLSIQTKP
jgi:hypothetical protein